MITYVLQIPGPDLVKRWRCSECKAVVEVHRLADHSAEEHDFAPFTVDANEFYQHNPEAPVRGE